MRDRRIVGTSNEFSGSWEGPGDWAGVKRLVEFLGLEDVASGVTSVKQMGLILWYQSDEDKANNLSKLNELLADGWRFVQAVPMSGTGDQVGFGRSPESRVLVILESVPMPSPAGPYR
jgi:hypothetical protein